MTPARRAELRDIAHSARLTGTTTLLLSTLSVEEMLDALDQAEARERRLRDLLTECADDLEARIDAEYPIEALAYPDNRRRRDRDLAPVLNARAALAEPGP